MPLNIKNPEVDELARKLAERTGESITEAVLNALKERLERTGKGRAAIIKDELSAIRRRCARLPVRDSRSPDEILGYDEQGLPR